MMSDGRSEQHNNKHRVCKGLMDLAIDWKSLGYTRKKSTRFITGHVRELYWLGIADNVKALAADIARCGRRGQRGVGAFTQVTRRTKLTVGGREVLTPEGGLYMAVVWPYIGKNEHLTAFLGRMYILSTLALGTVTRGIGLDDVWVGWPNDVYIHSRRAGMTLVRRLSTDIGEYVASIHILYLNVSIDAFPYSRRNELTTVKYEVGEESDPWTLSKALVEAINHLYALGFPRVRKIWNGMWRDKGKTLNVCLNPQVCVTGTARAIGKGGEVVLEVKDNKYGIYKRHKVSPLNCYMVY